MVDEFEFTTAHGALIVSTAALCLSIFTLARNRNSVSVYVGNDQEGEYFCLTNNSPHAVTVVDMGTVKARGGRRSMLQDPLKRRIDPRDVAYIWLRPTDDYSPSALYLPQGTYIELATGQRFYSRRRVIRALGHLGAWTKIFTKRVTSSSQP